ncbi:MAG: TlpA family protein disulfide reductase [Bacteroidales bacterium]
MKIIRSILVILLLVFVLHSCDQYKKTAPKTLRDSVVIVFKDPPDQKRFYYNSGSYSYVFHGTLRFVGDDGLLEDFDPLPSGDTLTIPCFGQDYIIVSHKYKGIEMHEFLLKHGDTVIVSYDVNNFPILKSRLSPHLTELYNLNYKVKNRTVNYGFEPQTILNDMNFSLAYLLKKKSKTIPVNTQKDLQHLLVNYIDLDSVFVEHQMYVSDFSTLLDSLEALGDVDENYLKFYRDRVNVISKSKIIQDLFQRSKSKRVNQEESVSQFALNDTFAYNYKYQNQLTGYLYNQTKAEGIKHYTTSNSKFPDYRTVFDNIANDELVPPLSKAVLLAYCFNNICENFKVTDKLSYYDKYLTVTNDSVKAESLRKRNNLDIEHTGDLILLDCNGKTITLKEAISTYKGKVVYLDFWAPWCSPCREEMANAENLHKYFKGKDLVFMNVVVFDTKSSWDKIRVKFEKNPQIHYYFGTNSRSSHQLDSLGVNLIPWFMIIDRDGRFVDSNAERPSSKDVYKEIERFL